MIGSEFIVTACKLVSYKSLVNGQESQCISVHVRPTDDPWSRGMVVNAFGLQELVDAFKPYIHVSDGGMVPDDKPIVPLHQIEELAPYTHFKRAVIKTYIFPEPKHGLDKNGQLIMNVKNPSIPAVFTSVNEFGVIAADDADGNPVWASSFNPDAAYERDVNVRFAPIAGNNESTVGQPPVAPPQPMSDGAPLVSPTAQTQAQAPQGAPATQNANQPAF